MEKFGRLSLVLPLSWYPPDDDEHGKIQNKLTS
jgi:hypothetical protein